MSVILTDLRIEELVREPKEIPKGLCPLRSEIQKNQYRRREFEFIGDFGSEFVLHTRQSTINLLDFSVILGYRVPGFTTIFRLRRYNGKHHHTNRAENNHLHDFHMHLATERYQHIPGAKVDGFARVDHRYSSLEGAIQCLLDDCGFRSPMEKSPLFTGTVI